MSEKVRAIGALLWYFVSTYPLRLKRFFFFYMSMEPWRRRWSFFEWILLLIDITGLPEIYQIFHELLNWNLRGLSYQELVAARSVFGNSIRLQCVRVNGQNTLFCKRMGIAFVSFHTIHYYNNIPNGIFIHELVHVWQYEKFGSAYIIRALSAQHTIEGYDYGGAATLAQKRDIMEFNFEQMAEIVRHGFELQGRSELHNNLIKQLRE